MESAIAHNLKVVRERISCAAEKADRNPSQIRLIGISKTFPFEAIKTAIKAGLIDFGENRLQEAVEKIERGIKLDVSWHLVGHLQSNKARKAVNIFDWIHSLDSNVLLRRIANLIMPKKRSPKLLIQVDLAGEETKHGASIEEARRMFDTAMEHKILRVRGLMTIPPWSNNPQDAKSYFARLREFKEDLLDDGVDPVMLTELSMGMSHDFEVAIEEGSTMVRIGTAIFGRREKINQ